MLTPCLLQVIRALYDYEAASAQELSFSRGDFFHVIGREDDDDWYEACNPALPDARGLVPVSFFQALGRTERDSGQSDTVPRLPPKKEDHDSGFSESNIVPQTPAMSQRSSKSMGKSGTMVYGIVMYDFQAERADELEAKAGEAIIVIAQSNPEWFVAKPIGRLGGPGLIPVTFVEIRDMVSDTPVANPHDAVKRAGVPKVEEWKKMTAEYKNSSITLGKFEGGGPPGQQQPLEQGMERLSLQPQRNRQSQQQNAVSVSRNLLTQIWCFLQLIWNLTTATTGESHITTTHDAEKPNGSQANFPVVCAYISSDTSILLCRGKVLVRHRGDARRRSPLGTFTLLRGLLRFPDCSPDRVPSRGREYWHTKTYTALYARPRQLRNRCDYRGPSPQPRSICEESTRTTGIHL